MVENLLSTKQVCEILGINQNNLHQIQHRGSLKWIERKGKNVFYDREHVNAYLEKRNKRGKKSE